MLVSSIWHLHSKSKNSDFVYQITLKSLLKPFKLLIHVTELGVIIMKWTMEGSLLMSTADWICRSFKHLNATHFAHSKQLNLHCTFYSEKGGSPPPAGSFRQTRPHETPEVPDSWCNGRTNEISSAAGTNSFNLVLFSLWQQLMKGSSRDLVLHVLLLLRGLVHCWTPSQIFFTAKC